MELLYYFFVYAVVLLNYYKNFLHFYLTLVNNIKVNKNLQQLPWQLTKICFSSNWHFIFFIFLLFLIIFNGSNFKINSTKSKQNLIIISPDRSVQPTHKKVVTLDFWFNISKHTRFNLIFASVIHSMSQTKKGIYLFIYIYVSEFVFHNINNKDKK